VERAPRIGTRGGHSAFHQNIAAGDECAIPLEGRRGVASIARLKVGDKNKTSRVSAARKFLMFLVELNGIEPSTS
jgi:hypothetical protein